MTQATLTTERNNQTIKIVIVLSILWHLLLLLFPWDFSFHKNSGIKPVNVQSLTSEQLSQIKKQILLSKKRRSEQVAPQDARYISDQNIDVKKEQRAKVADTLPQESKAMKRSQKKTNSQSELLKNLGVSVNYPKSTSSQANEDKKGQQGADQLVDDPSLALGSENLLKSERSVYYSYYSRLYQAVAPIWRSHINSLMNSVALAPSTYSTQTNVIFDSAGKLIEVQILTSSGVKSFDDAAKLSWSRVGRFPNPPKDLLDENDQIQTGWVFQVHVDQKLRWSHQPPRRSF